MRARLNSLHALEKQRRGAYRSRSDMWLPTAASCIELAAAVAARRARATPPNVWKRNDGLLKTTGLFAITAVAEILGCYLPWLIAEKGVRRECFCQPRPASPSPRAADLCDPGFARGAPMLPTAASHIAVALGWLWAIGWRRDIVGTRSARSWPRVGMAIIVAADERQSDRALRRAAPSRTATGAAALKSARRRR